MGLEKNPELIPYLIGWAVASILIFSMGAVESGKITLGDIFISFLAGAFSWLLVLGIIGVLICDILEKNKDKEIVLWKSKNYKPHECATDYTGHSIDDAYDHGYD